MNILLSKTASKQLKKVPEHIRLKFESWCDIIDYIGLLESRKYKGFHDEPLKGSRKGQRSVRLSRAIYKQVDKNNYELIEIIEVNKHDY